MNIDAFKVQALTAIMAGARALVVEDQDFCALVDELDKRDFNIGNYAPLSLATTPRLERSVLFRGTPVYPSSKAPVVGGGE